MAPIPAFPWTFLVTDRLAHPSTVTDIKSSVSSISELLGLPIKLCKYAAVDAQSNPPRSSNYSNPNAAFLMMGTDSKRPANSSGRWDPMRTKWGWAPSCWRTNMGNVLAARADGKDLAIDDFKMMCKFARRKLQSMFENSRDGSDGLTIRQEALDMITWENMVKFNEETGEL